MISKSVSLMLPVVYSQLRLDLLMWLHNWPEELLEQLQRSQVSLVILLLLNSILYSLIIFPHALWWGTKLPPASCWHAIWRFTKSCRLYESWQQLWNYQIVSFHELYYTCLCPSTSCSDESDLKCLQQTQTFPSDCMKDSKSAVRFWTQLVLLTMSSRLGTNTVSDVMHIFHIKVTILTCSESILVCSWCSESCSRWDSGCSCHF